MDVKHILAVTVLLTSAIYEASTRPSASESYASDSTDFFVRPDEIQEEIRRSAPPIQYSNEENTKSILEKINTVNQGLTKPQNEQINLNKLEPANLEVDQELLAKIQDLIASGKLNGFSDQRKQTVNNYLNEETTRVEYAKALPYLQGNQIPKSQSNVVLISVPYIASLPIMIPQASLLPGNFQNEDLNSMENDRVYTTRQGFPSFNIPWPFAQYFPVHIMDPLQAYLSGSSFIEYGPSADVCKRHQKSEKLENDIENEIEKYHYNQFQEAQVAKSRQARAVRKRNVSTKSIATQKVETKIKKTDKKPTKLIVAQKIDTKTKGTDNKPKKFFSKPVLTASKPLFSQQAERIPVPPQYDSDQDLRFGNGDIGWFWHKRPPPVSSPGFFINRLKVKKGGVAIAGPGGVATAGKGGAAIVGPGGLAYTQPGGLAVAGPAARVIALSSDVDLSSVVTRLREQAAEDGSVPRLLESVPEGKVVATGPVVYYHPTDESSSVQYLPFYGGAKGQYLEVKTNNAGSVLSEKIVSEEKISSENIVKNNNENLLSKVLAANLQSLQTLSRNTLRLHNLGRKVGYLGETDKTAFKNQLSSLGEAASNTIKLIDEVGDNIDVLFKSNVSKREYNEDNVGEEGVSIDSPDIPDEILSGINDGVIIAEAKPFGLAVVGDHGLASSRPMATAIASSGIAVARPQATAIAGIDPSTLNLQIPINQDKKKKKKN